jgi:hypothetical protein
MSRMITNSIGAVVDSTAASGSSKKGAGKGCGTNGCSADEPADLRELDGDTPGLERGDAPVHHLQHLVGFVVV